MNQQYSFWNTLVIPLIIILILATGYFVFHRNPEIMSQDAYYTTLVKNRSQSDAFISSTTHKIDNLNVSPPPKTLVHLSHRFTEMAPEEFKHTTFSAAQVEWVQTAQYFIIKTKTAVQVLDSTGGLVWKFQAPEKEQLTSGTPAALEKAVFISTESGHTYAFDIATGNLIWYIESASKHFRSPLISGTNLLLFVEEKANQLWDIQVIHAFSGELKKSFGPFEMPLAGSPIIDGDILYFATQTGHLSAVNINEGKTLWSSEASSAFKSPPAIVGERLYLTNEDGLALAFERKNGKKIGEIEVGASIHEPLRFIEGLQLALGVDSNGYLTAIDTKAAKRLWRYNLSMITGDHGLSFHKLTQKSLTALNFSSEIYGWTAWTLCASTRICIFDVKNGVLLHRIDLKGKPLAPFGIFGENPTLVIPVSREGAAHLVALKPKVDAPPAP